MLGAVLGEKGVEDGHRRWQSDVLQKDGEETGLRTQSPQCCCGRGAHQLYTIIAMLRPGQTLALAGPEARHYNHPATPPRPVRPPRPQQMFILAVTLPFLNGFS